MALSSYGLKVGVWYESENNSGDGIWYDYFLSEDKKSVRYIAFDYEGDDAYIANDKWSKFEEEIIDEYEFKEVDRRYILKEIELINVFNSIFK